MKKTLKFDHLPDPQENRLTEEDIEAIAAETGASVWEVTTVIAVLEIPKVTRARIRRTIVGRA